MLTEHFSEYDLVQELHKKCPKEAQKILPIALVQFKYFFKKRCSLETIYKEEY